MKMNRAGIELLKTWEGCKLEAYPDPATGGEPWTIGYGHTTAAGKPVVYKGLKITQQEAADILVADLAGYEAAVTRVLKRAPNENQFSAMVSLCYNIGAGNFGKSSVVRYFNAGEIQKAADAFRLWNKANGKVMKGLVNRREAERLLFLRFVNDEPIIPIPKPEVPEPFPSHEQSAWTIIISGLVAIAAAVVVWFMGVG
jgi:lysozyme